MKYPTSIPRLSKNTLLGLILFFGFIILVNLLYGTSYDPRPYYPTSIFAKQFPYNEGFGGAPTIDLASSAAPLDASGAAPSRRLPLPPRGPREGFEDASGVSNWFSRKTKKVLDTDEEESFLDNSGGRIRSAGGEPTRPPRKEGFETLMSGSTSPAQNINYLGNVESNVKCGNQSMGLSNSMGYLCLSKDQITYLQSRGGNARGKGDF